MIASCEAACSPSELTFIPTNPHTAVTISTTNCAQPSPESMAEGTYVVVVDRVSTESMAFAAKADTAGRAARNGRREVAASAASPSPRHLARHPFRVDGCVHLGADRLAIRCDPNVWITLKELCAAVLIMTHPH